MLKIFKNKKIYVLLVIFVLLISAIILFWYLNTKRSFANTKGDVINNEEQSIYYTINFDTNGGSNIDSVVVEEGSVIPKPNDPTKEGYTFIEWQLNNEAYDFSSLVYEELILTAFFEENKTTSNNMQNNTNDTSNNITNNNTTSSKINLNNNISVTEYFVSSGSTNCFFYMFVSNLGEVFPDADIGKLNNNPAYVGFFPDKETRREDEVSSEEIDEFLSNGTLKINASWENNFKSVMNKYKSGSYKGIANVDYGEENHRFMFSYDYLSFNGLKVNSSGESANKEIQNALVNATKFMGPCGGFDSYENKILDEELCSKYNLDCDRW